MLAAFFDNFINRLSKRRKYRTVRTYSYALKRFLSYINAVTHNLGGLTPIDLLDALDNYESFLSFGKYSDIAIVRKVAHQLGADPVGGSSISVHLAAVNQFINASEELRVGLLELESKGYISSAQMAGFSLERTVSITAPHKVRQGIKANSWLAGCLAGGVKKIKRVGLVATAKPSELAYTNEFGGDEKTFPIDKCKELLDLAPCPRDKVLWCLLAATGCRISEALTMLNHDILIDTNHSEKNTVLIIDPDTRRNELIKFLSESEINELPHKGRTSPTTFMIEPFASMFWVALDEYRTDEFRKQSRRHIPNRHPFFLRQIESGDPMCRSYQALYERFSKIAYEVTGEKYGFHSLRHMYGYYLANHCPNPFPGRDREFGIDITRVKVYMGHAKISTTKRYARQDAVMLNSTFAAINFMRLSGGCKTVLETQIACLESEIARLKSEISEEAV